MRIGIDIRVLDQNRETGIGRFLSNFLDFANSNDRENKYLLFGNQNTRDLHFASHIRIKIIPEFSKIYWDQIILSKEINKENLEIFFSPNYTAPVFSKAKLVVTCHDLYFLALSNNWLANWLRNFYCRLIWNKANCIIAVSEFSKKEVIFFLGSQEKAVRVVYDSVGEKFKPLRDPAALSGLKKAKGISQEFILYVGNLTEHKNLARLIAAYNLLAQPLKDNYQLVIVARKDENYPALLRLVQDFNISSRVVFLDLVSDEDLRLLYNASSVLVLVSLWEGFGLPVLEAMACAVPVVVSNTTSLPEVAGSAALYVNPLDTQDISQALSRVLTDENLRQELSAKGLEQAKNFGAENSARKILEIFKLCAE